MPKTTRASASQNQYRSIPVAIATSVTATHHQDQISQQQYYPINTATMQSNLGPQRMTHMHQQTPSYIVNPPMQASSSQYTPPTPAIPIPTRPSSGAWTQSDDAILMNARTQGQNWGQIQAAFFPTKTANACRKRHERLMDRRNSEDWDTLKFEALGSHYMAMRREIWSPLAQKTGDKWAVVEAKVLGTGLKNLQSAARASSRRARLSASHDEHDAHNSHYVNDSAVEMEDLEADFSVSPDTDCSYDQSQQQPLHMMRTQIVSHQQQHQMMREQQQHHQNRQYMGGQAMQGRGHSHNHSLGSISNGERNMGIPSIINRGPTGV